MSIQPTRRRIQSLLVAGAVVAGAWAVLWWPVRTQQGVNYLVSQHTVPLHLKLIRFVSRDLEYRYLVHHLTEGIRGDESKVLRLYEWVRTHIHRGVPKGMPVVDDHVWHIIVRGYGTSDQLADVLATLCAYANVPADLAMLAPAGHSPIYAITMVKIDGRWSPLDPYYGVIVRNSDQRLSSREEILAHPELVRRVAPDVKINGIAYSRLYEWLPEISSNGDLRPYRHMPLRRAWYELKHRVHAFLRIL